MSDIREIEGWIDRVRECYLADDQVMTDKLLGEALEKTNNAPQLMEIAGMIAYKYGDFEESIRLIEAAMFEISLSISGQLTLANAGLQTGDWELARTMACFLVEIIDRVPCSMLPDLTELASALEEYELAVCVCRAAYARNPSDDNAVFGVGFYMYRAGSPLELAKYMMNKAVCMNPESQVYRVYVATIHCLLGEWDTAYSHACQITDRALGGVFCERMVKALAELFLRYEDSSRFEKLVSAD